MLLNIINLLFGIYVNLKLTLINLKKIYLQDEEFYITKALLYNNIINFEDITYEFLSINRRLITNEFISHIFKKYTNCKHFNYIDQRIKIEYIFEGKPYIMYIQDNKYNLQCDMIPLLNGNLNTTLFDKKIIKYPFFSKKIMDLFKKNYYFPYFTNKKKKIYSLFGIDCKDIEYIKINDTDYTNKLIPYLKKIHSPLNDFGILNMCPVRIKWLLYENGFIMDFNEFNKLEIKFANYYLDEETFELVEHYIVKNNYYEYLISDIIYNKLSK